MELQGNQPGCDLALNLRASNEPVARAHDASKLIPFPVPGGTPTATDSPGPGVMSQWLQSPTPSVRERLDEECSNDRLAAALRSSKESGLVGTLLLFRLTEYPVLVETYGQLIGRELMRQVAERLLGMLRRDHVRDEKGDVLEQVAEDEFAIVLSCIEHIEDVANIAQRLAKRCTDVYSLGGLHLHVQCVTGVAQYPLHAKAPAELIRYARIALRQADARTSSRCHFFVDEHLKQQRDQVGMAAELEQALQQDRLVLHYQPQFALDSQKVIGVEALVRMVSKSGEIIPPNDFIPIAEDNGLIIPVGNWVIREACQQLKRWREAGCGSLRVAVNVSPRQLLDECLIDVVSEAVEVAGINFSDLEIEITEQCIVEHLPVVEKVLHELSHKGVRIAVDDFGTGYSALAYIAQLPLNLIKLDRSFLTDIPSDSRASQLVTALIVMAKELNLEILAEGVETQGHHQFLDSAGCQLGQGFGFARPCSAEACLALLQVH